VHDPSEDKSGDTDNFNEVLKHAIDRFPIYRMKISLDFYQKVRREDALKLTTWNKSLYEINTLNSVTAVQVCHEKESTNHFQAHSVPTLQHL
jgi:hypothetical protein